jgi:quercetin dioxygenase-like cupin family protein
VIIKQNAQAAAVPVNMEGAKDVTMQILIGPTDGSGNIVMRRFKVMPGGHTPLHTHDFEHVVKVEAGKGIAVDENGSELELAPGQSAFVGSNLKHQFKNPFDGPFEFLCVILNQDRK